MPHLGWIEFHNKSGIKLLQCLIEIFDGVLRFVLSKSAVCSWGHESESYKRHGVVVQLCESIDHASNLILGQLFAGSIQVELNSQNVTVIFLLIC